jgi:hypothetical protein
MVKERSDIRIAFIHLIPETIEFARLNIAGNERRLPCPRRTLNPGNGPLAATVELAKETFARKDTRETGPGCLG